MDISSKANRAQLRDYFKKNAIPTESQFAELISSMINQADDSIAKIDGQPLSLKPDVGDSGNKKVLNLYKSFDHEKPNWTLSLTPLSNQADPESAKPGLSFGDGDGASKLFISESTNGNVGIGTTSPTEKLEVEGNALIGSSGEELKIGHVGLSTWAGIAHKDSANATSYALIQNSSGRTILNSKADQVLGFRQGDEDKMVLSNGKLGIGTTDPQSKLDVEGGAVIGATYSGTDPAPANGLLVEGNVGIGTTSPSEKLHVSGNILSSGSLNFPKDTSDFRQMVNLWGTDYGIGIQTSTQYFRTAKNFAWYKGGSHNNGELNSGSGGTAQMVIKDGNVGIGTTSPTTRLSVSGDHSINDGLTIENIGAGNPQLRLKNGNNAAAITLIKSWQNGNKCGIAIHDGSSNILNINDGKVGIGTASPSEKLEVSGDAIIGESGEELKIGNIGYSDWAGIAHKDRANTNDYALIQHKDGRTILNSKSDKDLYFRQGNSDKMVINNGNVGIGTDSPSEKLEVSGNLKIAGPDINLDNNARRDGNNSGPHRRALVHNFGDNLTINYGGDYTGGVTVGSNMSVEGNLTVGELQVNDTIKSKGLIFDDQVSGHPKHDGAIYRTGGQCYIAFDDHLYFRRTTDGKTYDVGGWAMSDLKLKKNIHKETGILSRLLQLEVKNFQWKKGRDPEKEIGFIAQEVEPLFPELVGNMPDQDAEGTNLSLKYVSFGVLAVGAIQELATKTDAIIQKLQNHIEQLEAKLDG